MSKIGGARAVSKFSIGDRVVALPNTEWDSDIACDDPDYPITVLGGHYGHVVAECEYGCLNLDAVHVRWEGAIDNRKMPTIWTCNMPWHMYPEEIEHID